jgi:diguanylate cyclase (GGDEF)-like protein/PAS domain S-box-containing protein
MRIDQLSPITGEFIVGVQESCFRTERLPETVRHARILFALTAILNLLYFVSNWRFDAGQPPFYIALASRGLVVAVAFICFLVIDKVKSLNGAEVVMLAWASVTSLGVGVFVSSHGNTALFVMIMLPSVYWLVLPASFRVAALAGISCSAVMLCSYLLNESAPFTILGLGLVMIVLNSALALALVRANRLSRLEWAATQSERRAKEELAESRHALHRMLMCVPVPLLIVSKADGKLIHANEAAVEFLGGHPEEIGMNFLSDLRADLSQPVKSLDAAEGAPQRFEGVIRVADGTTRDVLVAARVLKIDGVEKVLVAGLDITDRKLLERRLERLATTDSLTGLANRAGFFVAVEQEIAAARRSGKQPALLMVDMDHFKHINDTYGHETGDLVLKSFAALCRRQFRSRDIIGRIGGKEFAIMLPQTEMDAALARAERLRAGAEKLRFRGRAAELSITASIGVAEVRLGEMGADAALSRADRALYSAKRAGRNRVAHADAATKLSEVA